MFRNHPISDEARQWKEEYTRVLRERAQLHDEIARLHRLLAAAYADESALPPSAKKRKHSDSESIVAPAAAAAAAPGGFGFGFGVPARD